MENVFEALSNFENTEFGLVLIMTIRMRKRIFSKLKIQLSTSINFYVQYEEFEKRSTEKCKAS